MTLSRNETNLTIETQCIITELKFQVINKIVKKIFFKIILLNYIIFIYFTTHNARRVYIFHIWYFRIKKYRKTTGNTRNLLEKNHFFSWRFFIIGVDRSMKKFSECI